MKISKDELNKPVVKKKDGKFATLKEVLEKNIIIKKDMSSEDYRDLSIARYEMMDPNKAIAVGSTSYTKNRIIAESKKYVVKDVEGGKELLVGLEGPDGADFDVYVKFGAPATVDDYDIRGYTGLPDENVVVYPTREGDYYITVYSYRGSGEYKLRASL